MRAGPVTSFPRLAPILSASLDTFGWRRRHCREVSGIEEKASLETTRVSVIVRTRDRRDLLVEALESLRAQSFRDFEAVVVNDSDKALDPSVAASFADLRVRVV